MFPSELDDDQGAYEHRAKDIVDYWTQWCTRLVQLYESESDPVVRARVFSAPAIGPSVVVLLRKEGFRRVAYPDDGLRSTIYSLLVVDRPDLTTQSCAGVVLIGDALETTALGVIESSDPLAALQVPAKWSHGRQYGQDLHTPSKDPRLAAETEYARRAALPRKSETEHGSFLEAFVASPLTEQFRTVEHLIDEDTTFANSQLATLTTSDNGWSFTGKGQAPAKYALRLLVGRGAPGVKLVSKTIAEANARHAWLQDALRALYLASLGRFIDVDAVCTIRDSTFLPTTQPVAQKEFDDILVRALSDVSLFRLVVDLAVEFPDCLQQAFEAVQRTTIVVGRELLHTFRDLVGADEREEIYQQFLTQNPVLLDPLARRVIPKHALGTEHVTDFVIWKVTGEYLVVEIEKPQDPIFTRGDDFSYQFTHAFSQVLDFQEWLERHPEYAARNLPGVVSPFGLLVIGRRTSLSPTQARKLARFNTNSQRVRVACFDDLVDEAEKLHENVYRSNSR